MCTFRLFGILILWTPWKHRRRHSEWCNSLCDNDLVTYFMCQTNTGTLEFISLFLDIQCIKVQSSVSTKSALVSNVHPCSPSNLLNLSCDADQEEDSGVKSSCRIGGCSFRTAFTVYGHNFSCHCHLRTVTATTGLHLRKKRDDSPIFDYIKPSLCCCRNMNHCVREICTESILTFGVTV